MKIVVASDHAGLDLKLEMIKVLEERKNSGEDIEINDIGTHDKNSTDYPMWGEKAAVEVAEGRADKGLIICGTGMGISLAANKVKGVRAAVCSDTYTAKMSREHNNCNMLALGARTLGTGLATDILNIWLDTPFEEGGRHQRRVDMLVDIENRRLK
ncbi:MAG: ribose 5-phosphate isomerase B [Candidatus Ancillula sp.]|jgi:ribose 5-phosphate isomerase B|nr:ribose 5-phosphate isomerase B [Candidatus Ancillula sp.]